MCGGEVDVVVCFVLGDNFVLCSWLSSVGMCSVCVLEGKPAVLLDCLWAVMK